MSNACAEASVRRLDVFGSFAGENFGPDSDVDVVALFDRKPGKMFSRYFDLKERLEEIFGRPVDLVLEDSIKNPYFREAVERSRIKIYIYDSRYDDK
ncbi:MAG: nucleotidyltransferase domain-containing protein [Candidatus Omnitrophota bacterium]